MAGIIPKPDYGNLKLLLGPICLRRSTSSVLSSLGVNFIERRPCLSDAERRAYDELAVSCGQSIKAAVNGRLAKGGSNLILTAMLRLRIFCNTGLASPVDGTSEDVEQFRPDEVISLLQQRGEANCAECNSELLSSDAIDGSERQQGFSRRRLKCQGCAQRASSVDHAGSASGDPQSLTNLAADDMMQDLQINYEGGSAPTNNTPDCGSYPSKLTALLTDIREHYSQDKR